MNRSTAIAAACLAMVVPLAASGQSPAKGVPELENELERTGRMQALDGLVRAGLIFNGWEELFYGPNGPMYLLKDIKSRPGGIRLGWVFLSLVDQSALRGSKPPVIVRSDKSQYWADCAGGGYDLRMQILYDNPEGSGEPVFTFEKPETQGVDFAKAAPGSVEEGIVKRLCRDSPPAPAAKGQAGAK